MLIRAGRGLIATLSAANRDKEMFAGPVRGAEQADIVQQLILRVAELQE